LKRRWAIAAAAVVGVVGLAGLLSQAGAGVEDADPGLGQAEAILDCDASEGVFAYHATWGDGAKFDTPREALAGLLRGKGFDFTEDDFVSKDVEVRFGEETAAAEEFTIRDGDQDRVVTWAAPVDGGWLADSMYGCSGAASMK
jgi:hypothetical protein